MEYYDNINGRDVWVTIQRPFVLDREAKKYVLQSGYCAAFKFDKEPGVVIGEYLRDERLQLQWFPNPDDAAAAAFEEAAKHFG